MLAACALALAAIAAAARVGPRVVWSRARVVLPLVVFVAVFVPFVRGGERIDVGPLSLSEDGLTTFASVASKAAIGTVSAVLLGATTSFPDVLHGLERMRAPRLLVLIAAFMYRYLFVIADEARRMRVGARRARLPPAARAPGGRDRARGDRAVPAHLRPRASACTWRCSPAATPVRCRA